jgi:hypothetical protein
MKNISPPKPSMSFSVRELSGSLGDLGLFIPLVVAVAYLSEMNLGTILIAAGAMNIATGYLFRQPIPVQPMKAIAAVAITDGLTSGSVMAAGMGMAVLLLALSLSGGIEWMHRYVPNALVRGIQLGIGLKLAIKGVQWIQDLPAMGLNSIATAVVVGGLLLLFLTLKVPGLLFIFLGGFLFVYLEQPSLFSAIELAIPPMSLAWPSPREWQLGLWHGALPQLPLTLLNSVIAVCALSADYFPRRGIPPRKMALSVAMMNFVCVPFGAVPMCHGAGGLAAQYSFGARTGGSVVMLGIMKVLMGLVIGGFLLQVLTAYPFAILAPMLILAGIELAKGSLLLEKRRDRTIALITAVGILGGNTIIGFLLGAATILCYALWKRIVASGSVQE